MLYAPRSMSPDSPAECDDEAGRLPWQREEPGAYISIISQFALLRAAFYGHSLQESVSRFQYDQGRSGNVPSA